jgi:hypothetical protein
MAQIESAGLREHPMTGRYSRTGRTPTKALQAFCDPRRVHYRGRTPVAVEVKVGDYKAVLKYLGDTEGLKELAALRKIKPISLADYLDRTGS